MAAFSYQDHHPFLLDSVFMPNTPIKMYSFSEEPNNPTPCFSQFYQPTHHRIQTPPQQIPPHDVSVHQNSCLEHSTKVVLSNNEPSLTNKHSTDSSSVVDKPETSEQITQLAPMDRKRKNKAGSSFNSAESKDARRVKSKKPKKGNGGSKDVEEKKPRADKKDPKEAPEETPTDYIHVRARRGQATDSHSLAERVRREKISERMKMLQALVPGCDKVTGKALMLDEIINYVQSLQNQVEFLSMKLACVNPMLYDFGMDLDSFMVGPERMNSLGSPLPNVQQCSPTQATAFAETANMLSTTDNYLHLDSSASLVFQQGQLASAIAQADGQLLWVGDDQRQKRSNQSGLSNNLCSFH